MMITRRDLSFAVAAALATLGVTAAAQPGSVLRSSAFEWSTVEARSTDVGSVRQFLRAPTATLDELELHVTTLSAGLTSHAPHKHPNKELIIVREGTVEVLVQGQWQRVGPGSVIFNASNELHGLKNVGSGSAIYHVINWSSPGMLKKTP